MKIHPCAAFRTVEVLVGPPCISSAQKLNAMKEQLLNFHILSNSRHEIF